MKLFPKPSHVLAFAGWGYVFVSGMFLIVRTIPSDSLSWGLFTLFLIIAVFASAVAQGKTKVDPTDVRINMANEIYTAEDLKVHLLKDGSMFIYVDLAHPSKNKKTESSTPAQAHHPDNRKKK